jgi:hypothetical protein
MPTFRRCPIKWKRAWEFKRWWGGLNREKLLAFGVGESRERKKLSAFGVGEGPEREKLSAFGVGERSGRLTVPSRLVGTGRAVFGAAVARTGDSSKASVMGDPHPSARHPAV